MGGYRAHKFSGLRISRGISDLEEDLDHVTAYWEKRLSLDEETGQEELANEVDRGCKRQLDDSDEPDADDPDTDDFESESDLEWNTPLELCEAVKAREMEQEKVPWPTLMTGT